MPSPLVSVIIPCYRQGRFLASSVRSALQQSYSPIEVIVVNDGSDDDTEQVAHSFGDRIRYIHQANAGVSAARNAGINQARGEYLHFLDADDLIHPDAIGWLVDAAQGHSNPLCVMGYRNFKEDSDLTSGKAVLPPFADRLEPVMLYYNFGPPVIHLCRRELYLSTGGFKQGLATSEDWDMWTRLVFAGAEIVPIYRIGGYYRRHANSASRNGYRMAVTAADRLRQTLNCITVEPEVVVRMGGDPRSTTRAVRRSLTDELLSVAYHLRQQNRYALAAYQFCNCLREMGWSGRAVAGLLKLLPHRIMRSLNVVAF